MSTIYLVTQGSYSDYGVVAAFSTKEKAEEYINYMKEGFKGTGRSSYCTDEYNEVLEMNIDEPETDWACMQVWMDRDGNLDEGGVDMLEGSYFSKTHDKLKFSDNAYLICITRGNDKKRCIKVANEFRTQYLAAGLQWGCNDTLKWWLSGLKKISSDE